MSRTLFRHGTVVTAADQEALWSGLRDGSLAVVSTDHCPFNLESQKTLGLHDFTRIPGGVPAIEDRQMVVHDAGVNHGRITLNRFVEPTSTNPARLFGLYPRKGTIAVAADADLVLFDPRVSARWARGRITCGWTTICLRA